MSCGGYYRLAVLLVTTLLESLGVADIRSAARPLKVIAGAPRLPFPRLTNMPQPPDNPADTVVATLRLFVNGEAPGYGVGESTGAVFRSQYAPDDVLTVEARNAAGDLIPFPNGLRWAFENNGNSAYALFVEEDATHARVEYDEEDATFDINEDGLLISVAYDPNPLVGSGSFTPILLAAELTSYSIAPETAHLQEGPAPGSHAVITASALDQFGYPVPLPSVGAWVCDPPGGVNFSDPAANPVTISFGVAGVFEVMAFLDIGEPPVETESNHCIVTCTS